MTDSIHTSPTTEELYWCAYNDDPVRMAALLSRGVDVNAIDYDKRTPIHIAAHQLHPRMVRLLLAAGADTTMKDRYNRTSIDCVKHASEQMGSDAKAADSIRECLELLESDSKKM